MSPMPEDVGAPRHGEAACLRHLEDFFERVWTPCLPAELIVAFSGGPDSTALLHTLASLARAPRWRGLELRALHVDHRLDDDSPRRAERARALAATIGIRCEVHVLGRPSRASGLEAWAREERYELLERERSRSGAAAIVTAHHLDDQFETVLLRLQFGSALPGLAGIEPVRGRILRPLLGCDRDALQAVLGEAGLRAIRDPTNFAPGPARNAVRHDVVPRLLAAEPDLPKRVAATSRAARRARRHLGRIFWRHLDPRVEQGRLRVRLDGLRALSRELLRFAMVDLFQRAGAAHGPTHLALDEIERQLAEQQRGRVEEIGCDAGNGWRVESRRSEIVIFRRAPAPAYSYELTPALAPWSREPAGHATPGEAPANRLLAQIRLAEIGRSLSIATVDPDRQAPSISGLCAAQGVDLDLYSQGERCLTVRNRREGDRIWPVGRDRSIRLKRLFDRARVPREHRPSWPVLCRDDEPIWVPGIACDRRVDARGGRQSHRVELWPSLPGWTP